MLVSFFLERKSWKQFKLTVHQILLRKGLVYKENSLEGQEKNGEMRVTSPAGDGFKSTIIPIGTWKKKIPSQLSCFIQVNKNGR